MAPLAAVVDVEVAALVELRKDRKDVTALRAAGHHRQPDIGLAIVLPLLGVLGLDVAPALMPTTHARGHHAPPAACNDEQTDAMTHPTNPLDLAVLLISASLSEHTDDEFDAVRVAAFEDFVGSNAGPAPAMEAPPGEPFMQWLEELVTHHQEVQKRLARVVGVLLAMAGDALTDLQAESGRPALAWVEAWRAAQD